MRFFSNRVWPLPTGLPLSPPEPAPFRRLNFWEQVDAWGRFLIIASSGGLLVFATLAYGAVHPWAYFPVALLVGVLGLVLLARGLLALRAPAGSPWPYPPLWWLVVGLGLVVVLQVSPWPQGWVAWLSPTAREIRALGNGFGLAAYLPLSMNPYATLLESLKLAPALGLFFLLLYATGNRRHLLALVGVILALALFEVLYGFLSFRHPRIWGWANPYAGSRLCGTFININHLGSFLAMAILLGLGLALAVKPVPSRLPEDLTGWRRLRRRFRAEHLEPYFRTFLLLFLLLLLTVGLIFSGSRGALLSLMVGLGLMALLFWGKDHAWGPLGALAGFLLVALVFSLWLGGSPFLARWLESPEGGRYFSLRGALSLFREFPWLGSGLGTFGDLFFRYEPAHLEGATFSYAHSDWLQMLGETGIIGFGLLAAAFWAFFLHLLQQWRRRQDRWARGLGLGGLAALAAGAFHALGEFPFHTSAISLTYAAIAALTYLCLHHHQVPGPGYFSYPTLKPLASRRRIAALFLAGLLGVQLAWLGLALRFWGAEVAAPTEIDSTRPAPTPTAADYRRALALNPLNSKYYLGLAETLEKEEAPGAARAEAEASLKAAVFYAPAHWGYRYKLGEFFLRHCRSAPARYLPQGLRELAAATRLFPESSSLHFYLAEYLVWAKKTYPALVPRELWDADTQQVEDGLDAVLKNYIR